MYIQPNNRYVWVEYNETRYTLEEKEIFKIPENVIFKIPENVKVIVGIE